MSSNLGKIKDSNISLSSPVRQKSRVALLVSGKKDSNELHAVNIHY